MSSFSGFNKGKSKSTEQEFSKELSRSTSINTFGKSMSKNKFSQNSHGTPQTGKGYDITIPTGIEPGE